MMKVILIALMSITLANCSQTYKVKQEANIKDNRLLNEVPQWYIDAQIDDGIILNRDADKYIYPKFGIINEFMTDPVEFM